MNNEPVAWIWSEDGCNLGVCLEQDKQIGKQEFADYSIPLYTHPADLINDAQYDRGFDAGCKHAEQNLQAEIEEYQKLIAILRKAQEK